MCVRDEMKCLTIKYIHTHYEIQFTNWIFKKRQQKQEQQMRPNKTRKLKEIQYRAGAQHQRF